MDGVGTSACSGTRKGTTLAPIGEIGADTRGENKKVNQAGPEDKGEEFALVMGSRKKQRKKNMRPKVCSNSPCYHPGQSGCFEILGTVQPSWRRSTR